MASSNAGVESSVGVSIPVMLGMPNRCDASGAELVPCMPSMTPFGVELMPQRGLQNAFAPLSALHERGYSYLIFVGSVSRMAFLFVILRRTSFEMRHFGLEGSTRMGACFEINITVTAE